MVSTTTSNLRLALMREFFNYSFSIHSVSNGLEMNFTKKTILPPNQGQDY